jgi:hypothetical protein
MRAPRKTAPKVKLGKVQRKNNWAETPDADYMAGTTVVFQRERAAKGFRHIVGKRDLERFISLLPDWGELAVGLEVILLAPGDEDCDGWHCDGWVALEARPRALWELVSNSYYREHRKVYELLGVPVLKRSPGVEVQYTENSLRAFQLMHVLLHELGHHHDRMTTRSQRQSARGESYAEQYALRYMGEIWDSYITEFGHPS